jgi:hypothetical protein
MGHYAFIDNSNIVVEVITGRDEWEIVDGITDWEAYYTTKREGLRAIRTSYNTLGGKHTVGGVAFRGNYAGIGYSYDEGLDAFIPPKDYDSWILNEETCQWEPPVAYPEDGNIYEWNEDTVSWDLVEYEQESEGKI